MKKTHLLFAAATASFMVAPTAFAQNLSGERSYISSGTVPANNQAVAATVAREPLLVIRFNQKRVYFDRMVRQAVEAAKREKSDVVFDVVSFIPATLDGRGQGLAQQNLQNVMSYMAKIGAGSINPQTKPVSNVPTQEIHLFVR